MPKPSRAQLVLTANKVVYGSSSKSWRRIPERRKNHRLILGQDYRENGGGPLGWLINSLILYKYVRCIWGWLLRVYHPKGTIIISSSGWVHRFCMGLQLFVQISKPYTLNSHTAFNIFNPPRIIEESLSYRFFLLGSWESGVFWPPWN